MSVAGAAGAGQAKKKQKRKRRASLALANGSAAGLAGLGSRAGVSFAKETLSHEFVADSDSEDSEPPTIYDQHDEIDFGQATCSLSAEELEGREIWLFAVPSTFDPNDLEGLPVPSLARPTRVESGTSSFECCRLEGAVGSRIVAVPDNSGTVVFGPAVSRSFQVQRVFSVPKIEAPPSTFQAPKPSTSISFTWTPFGSAKEDEEPMAPTPSASSGSGAGSTAKRKRKAERAAANTTTEATSAAAAATAHSSASPKHAKKKRRKDGAGVAGKAEGATAEPASPRKIKAKKKKKAKKP